MHFCPACGFHLPTTDSTCCWCGFTHSITLATAQMNVLSNGHCFLDFQPSTYPSFDSVRSPNFNYDLDPSTLLYQALTLCAQHFFGIRLLSTSQLITRQDVREMCSPSSCQAYGTNWTCPPAIDAIDICQQKISSYHDAILLQTAGTLTDSFDFEEMMSIEKTHNQRLMHCRNTLQKSHHNVLALGAGACRICNPCTYPSAECAYPELSMASLEAYGLLVNDLCTKTNLPYYYGINTISFLGCLFI